MNNSMIAKLLAKENITVEHGNFRTAFFDVEKRVLGLPMWKDMGKNVYDLLVGHEVGHALYTPADGWHDSVKDLGIPRAYINIVEDIRIEKLIQRTYPGLVGSFKRGYSVLREDDFFGIADKDVNSLHIADRLNLKSKLRDLIDVEFANNELEVIDQCFAVETWEDVLDACRALYNFVEENKDEQQEQSFEDAMEDNDSNDNFLSSDSDQSSDGEDGEQGEDNGSSGSSNISDEGEPSGEESVPDAPNGDQGEDKKQVAVPPNGAGGIEQVDPHASITDNAFRGNEEKLVETDNKGFQAQVVKAITRQQMNEMVNEYGLIAEQRKKWNEVVDVVAFNEELKEFNESTKKFVAIMAKEFEMRKMAYRTKRAQTSRSGSLDLTKLHSYRYNDDIFNKVTRLADAKSHGMVMFIDFSGSMHGILADTIRQSLILATFCKKVNIPFEVYSFTTGNPLKERTKNTGVVAQFDIETTNVNELLSSDMKKSTYEQAYRELFMIASRKAYVRVWDSLGGTPLNETVMASRFILADFKARTRVQKVNVVFLTDGDAQSMYVDEPYFGPEENRIEGANWNKNILMDGKTINASRGNNVKITTALLNELRKEYTVIGYFLAERPYDFRGKVWAAHDTYVADEKMREFRKEYNTNKFISFSEVLGYDSFFIIKAEGRSLATDDDEFEVSENAKKGEIQRAFKKHANSKKTNKLFATQFAKMVA
jgi:hypothetical protein